MQIFEGQLWLVPEYANELNVEIHLDEERIRLFSGTTVIGNWRLDEFDLEVRGGHIFMDIEGEELIIWPTDPALVPALTGQEIEESEEPYVPYEPPSKARAGRGRRGRRRSFFRRLFHRP